MAGLSDYLGFGSAWAQPTDDLIRQAQQGDLSAYKELIKRGEEVPPPGDPVGRFGKHGRPGGPPVPVLGLQRPAYLDRGISRNMARPAADAPDQPPLPFMSAINGPQQEAPNYLGMNLGQGGGDDPIARIANGHDAAAPIQQGAQAADIDAGEQHPASVLPGPIGAMAQALDHDDDSSGYSGYIGDVIKRLMSGSDPEANRRQAIAQAGFAMAASNSPTFLGGVGAGGLAGLRSYQQSQDRDMEYQVRAAQLAGHEMERQEDIRAHKADETLSQGRLTEEQRSNQAREAESARSNRVQESISRGQLRISGMNAQTALDSLQQRQNEFEEEKRRYQEGKSTDDALKRAQVKLTEAQIKAQESLEVDRNTEILYAPEGAYMFDKRTQQSVPITDKDGKQIKASSKTFAPTAEMKNNRYFVDIGLFPDEATAAAARMRGKVMSPDRRQVEAYKMADGQLANHPELIGADADAQREQWAQQYYDLLGGDAAGTPGAPAAQQTPSSEGPSAAAPASSIPIGATATNPQTKEQVRWDGKQWVKK